MSTETTDDTSADATVGDGAVMRGGRGRRLVPALAAGVAIVLAIGLALAALTERDGTSVDVVGDEDEGSQTAPEPLEPEALSDEEQVEAVTAAFAEAWQAADWESLQAVTADQGLDAGSVHAGAHNRLRVEETRITLGEAVIDGDRATRPAQVVWDLGDLGEVDFTVELVVRRVEGDDPAAPPPDADVPEADDLGEIAARVADLEWRIGWWYPMVHPELTPERRFERVRQWPERASILGADGAELVRSVPETVIGAAPSRVGDPELLADELAELVGADRDAVLATLTRDDLDELEEDFVELLAVPIDELDEVRTEVSQLPAIRLRDRSLRDVEAPETFHRLLGSTDEITAELLEEFGDPYRQGDRVGRAGLERSFERRLAGLPSEEARIVDGTGLVRSLAFVEGEDAAPVQLSLDPNAQEAAVEAIAGVEAPIALVAIHAPTGEVRASAFAPTDEFDRALTGSYPPGSTFKVVTAAALLQSGMGLEDPIACPPTITLGGRSFRNAGGDGPGTISLLDAFARSCNTAFAGGAANLGADTMIEAANLFGFNEPISLGLPGAGGTYPEPADTADLGASSIGQGRVSTSPVHMASVAAAVAAGTWKAPRIVVEPEADWPADRELEPAVRDALDAAMEAVVTRGTGGAAALPGEPVKGKTGSAQFGAEPPFDTHAWFIGYRGDLAFAVVVEGGGAGGRVAGPIAARFLSVLEGLEAPPPPELVPEEGPEAEGAEDPENADGEPGDGDEAEDGEGDGG